MRMDDLKKVIAKLIRENFHQSLSEGIPKLFLKIEAVKKEIDRLTAERKSKFGGEYARKLNAETDPKKREQLKEPILAISKKITAFQKNLLKLYDMEETYIQNLDKDVELNLSEMSKNDVHFKEIMKMYDRGGSFTKKKVAVIVCRNSKASRRDIEEELLDTTYEDIVQYQDELNIKESVEGDRIQKLNDRIKALRDKMNSTKSSTQKNLIQQRLKNALQTLTKIKSGLGIKKINNESVNEVASVEAKEIGALTGVRGDAVQKFIDDNNIHARKLLAYLKIKGPHTLSNRMDISTAIVGKANNKYAQGIIKAFSESKVNEAFPTKKVDAKVIADRMRNHKETKGFADKIEKLKMVSAEDLDKMLPDYVAGSVITKIFKESANEAAVPTGEKIQNLNNRIKALKDKMAATKSSEQKNLIQQRLKNALQSLSNYKKQNISKESKISEDKGPCWQGYKQVGMKNKSGRQVPNCVPNESIVKEIGGIPKMYKAFSALTLGVRKLEDEQLKLRDKYFAEKELNKKNALMQQLKKGTAELKKWRDRLSKVETDYVMNLDIDSEYSG